MSTTNEARLAFFQGRTHDRYWWFEATGRKSLPAMMEALSDEEWDILKNWYSASEVDYENGTGECNVPSISLILGIISGNSINKIVQCGHFIGYSTLLIGFFLRHMHATHGLFSVDINPSVTEFTQSWVDRAGLQRQVHLEVNDSSAPELPAMARAYLGGRPQLVFIDSSHEYQHTLAELDLWYPELMPGGFILLHDVSKLSSEYNQMGKGGVRAAAKEWTARNNAPCLLINEFAGPDHYGDRTIYKDACGLGVIQKPDD